MKNHLELLENEIIQHLNHHLLRRYYSCKERKPSYVWIM